MIIEKVFSNTEDPEESLYSVLMTEEEIRMYAINAARYYDSLQKMSAAERAAKATMRARNLEHAFKGNISVVGNTAGKTIGTGIPKEGLVTALKRPTRPLPPPAKRVAPSLVQQGGIKVSSRVPSALAKRPAAPINNGFQMSSTLKPNGGGFQYV